METENMHNAPARPLLLVNSFIAEVDHHYETVLRYSPRHIQNWQPKTKRNRWMYDLIQYKLTAGVIHMRMRDKRDTQII